MRIKYAKPLHRFRLSRLPDKRYHMVRIMVCQLMQHERIYTTAARAKHIRSTAEALITMGRKYVKKMKIIEEANLEGKPIPNLPGDLKRKLEGNFHRFLTSSAARQNFFANVVPRFMDRNGACTRVVNLDENRKGDNAPISYIELIGK